MLCLLMEIACSPFCIQHAVHDLESQFTIIKLRDSHSPAEYCGIVTFRCVDLHKTITSTSACTSEFSDMRQQDTHVYLRDPSLALLLAQQRRQEQSSPLFDAHYSRQMVIRSKHNMDRMNMFPEFTSQKVSAPNTRTLHAQLIPVPDVSGDRS